MWPGYGGEAYHSPIKIEACQQDGGTIKLDFYNAAYAAGVRDFSYRLAPLAHRPEYLIAAITDQPERTVAVVELRPAWLKSHMPEQFDKLKRLADATGLPPREALGLLAMEWGGPKEGRRPPPPASRGTAVGRRRGEFISGGSDLSLHEAILDDPAAELALYAERSARLAAQGFTRAQIEKSFGPAPAPSVISSKKAP